MPHRRADRDPGEGGFTLIEGMIALVVLSIGLLAVSGMQAVSLSRNVDANQLSQVTHLTAEMVERVRFNRGNVIAYNGIDTAVVATRPPATQPQARGDYDQWGARLTQSGIAGIRGQVTVAALAPTALSQSQVTVRVNWIGGLLNRAVVMTTVVVPE
jgi:type IV pilus assembly protein PilV